MNYLLLFCFVLVGCASPKSSSSSLFKSETKEINHPFTLFSLIGSSEWKEMSIREKEICIYTLTKGIAFKRKELDIIISYTPTKKMTMKIKHVGFQETIAYIDSFYENISKDILVINGVTINTIHNRDLKQMSGVSFETVLVSFLLLKNGLSEESVAKFLSYYGPSTDVEYDFILKKK